MPHERKIILLVDDDGDFLSELQDSLALSGYIPIAAFNGQEALKLARRIMPDLILLDLKLGVEDGVLVAKNIRNYPPTSRIPVIMMSGYFNESGNLNRMVPSALNIYLKKPFGQKEVVRSIQTVLADNVDTPFDVMRYLVVKNQ